MTKKALGQRIKEIRKQKKITQVELAELVGYKNRSMITKIEKGAVDLSESKIKAIAKALCVTPHNLVGWEYTQYQPKDMYYVDTSTLTDAQLGEIETIINVNIAMLSRGVELTEHDRKIIRKAITEAYIETTTNKE